VLDGRDFIILPDGGLTLHHMGYADNVAHGILLAVDQPDVSQGRIYNCADEEVLSLRQSVAIIAAAVGRQIEVVSMPWELAPCTRPLVMQPLTTHRVLDISRIRGELGYRDAVPAREALARTARWLAEHPPAPGGIEEMVLEDPFDDAAEDRLRASGRDSLICRDFVRNSRGRSRRARRARRRARRGRRPPARRGCAPSHARVRRRDRTRPRRVAR
jgi:hypothetical protein